uniref:Uncharacterized protein n=1 Tax=viral metagenome TaxID=1070528 RepID=A0A6M3ITJ4_9ZZZZ
MGREGKGNRRFVGGNIPLELWEVFMEVMVERGIDTQTDAILQAVALFVDTNPPSGGVPKAIQELLKVTDRSQAVRKALDAAVVEWRLKGSKDIVRKVYKLSSEAGGLILPQDITAAIDTMRHNDEL